MAEEPFGRFEINTERCKALTDAEAREVLQEPTFECLAAKLASGTCTAFLEDVSVCLL
jgi:hypothetical protein